MKWKALHQWCSESCPDQHHLQTWHILRFFLSPTGPEDPSVGPNKFVLTWTTLQIKFDNLSRLPQTSCTSPPPPWQWTVSYCSQGRKKKKKRKAKRTCVDSEQQNQQPPTTSVATYSALSTPIPKLVPPPTYITSPVPHCFLLIHIFSSTGSFSLACKPVNTSPTIKSHWPTSLTLTLPPPFLTTEEWLT